MRTTKYFIMTLLAVLAVTLCAQGAFAEGIKDRMKSRLPVINALKAQGVVGENNKGFLEYRGGKKPSQDVIQAENQDRLEVYKAIAARQKTTPEFVGKARAAQIAEKESGGVWVQSPDGSWNKN